MEMIILTLIYQKHWDKFPPKLKSSSKENLGQILPQNSQFPILSTLPSEDVSWKHLDARTLDRMQRLVNILGQQKIFGTSNIYFGADFQRNFQSIKHRFIQKLPENFLEEEKQRFPEKIPNVFNER